MKKSRLQSSIPKIPSKDYFMLKQIKRHYHQGREFGVLLIIIKMSPLLSRALCFKDRARDVH